MSGREDRMCAGAVEALEKRELFNADVQIIPLHGPYCHCVACSAAQTATAALNAEASAGLEPSAKSAVSSGSVVPIGVFVPPAAPTPRIATVIPLFQASAVAAETGSALDVVASGSFSAKINFQPSWASIPGGYAADFGRVYGLRTNGQTYGWKVSNEGSHYDRNSSKSPDQRYDTLAKMSSSDVWEIKVPNGWYNVDIYVGDANISGADLRVKAEGKLAVWTQLHYPEKRFGEGHIKLYVGDGRLTLTTGSGAINNSIDFVHVTASSPPKGYAYKNDLGWYKSSLSSPTRRVESGVVRVGDKVYFIGGYNGDYDHVTNRVDILNLKTYTWTKGASLPGAQTHAGATTDGRYIYWVGGQYGVLYSRKGTNEGWRYDTQQNKWERFANLPEVRFGGGLEYVNGSLYFFGGDLSDRNTASAKAWKLQLSDPTGAGWQRIADLPRAADHLGHAELKGLIYAFGGEHDHGNSYIQHADVFSYNPSTNVWTRRADMPTASSHFEGNIIEYKDKIWIFGGQVDAQQLTSEVRSYDPATNSWTKHNSLPEQRKGGGGWVYNGKFFYLTGDAQGKGQPTYALGANIFS